MPSPQSFPPTFDGLVQVLARLRDPQGGCPWDLAQTHQSLRATLLEECYETLEALDQGDPRRLAEELGDLVLQVAFHGQMAQEAGAFTLEDVFRLLNDKLVRRHPHVFGDAQASTPWEVEVQWEEVKRQERGVQGAKSLLEGVPRAMPALGQSQALQERAARVGFDWESVDGVLEKLLEEARELEAAATQEQREEEVGDLLFTMVNLSRWLKVDAESALRKSAQRFARRFAHMEAGAQERGVELKALSLEGKEALWRATKEALGP